MKVIKLCPQCSKEVIQFYPSYPRVYCSRECQWKAKVKDKPKCLVCGKLVKRQSLKYCSSKCYGISNQGKERLKLRKKFIKQCEKCNKDFEVGGRGGKHKGAKFCSLECQYRANRKPMEEHSNLTDSAEWKELRLKIAKRDNYTCQLCLCILDITKIEVNHIVPRRVHMDNSENNLISLCNLCHSAFDRLILLGYKNNEDFDAQRFFILLKQQLYKT